MATQVERIEQETRFRRAVLRGDEEAWRRWYDQTFATLQAYVLWRCAGLKDLAEEILQETWMTAVRRMRVFDPKKASFLTWLRGIAAHHLANQLRRRASRNGKPLAEIHPTVDGVEHRDRAEQIAWVLSQLPPHYEDVLRAKYLEEKSIHEIAQKAIESLLSRARQAFRKAYQTEEDTNELKPR